VNAEHRRDLIAVEQAGRRRVLACGDLVRPRGTHTTGTFHNDPPGRSQWNLNYPRGAAFMHASLR